MNIVDAIHGTTVQSPKIDGLNGKKLYQVHMRSRVTYTYIEPVYVSAKNDEEAWEKALDLEAGKFQVKSCSTEWIDEAILDEEQKDIAERFPDDVHQRSHNVIGDEMIPNPKYAGSESERKGKDAI